MAYEKLAQVYDELTTDINYTRILDFIETILRDFGKQPETVLDLACGTGSMSLLLAQRGYRVLGADMSEEMLTVAMDKAQQLEKNMPYFVCQKMQNLRLPAPVDLALCLLDSVNYLRKPSDCEKTFQRVFQALKPGGVFLFDINTPHKLRGLDGQVFLDETQETFCVWRAQFEREENCCYYGFDIFRKQGSAWTRRQEQHCEYAYEPETLCGYLRAAGFTRIVQFGDCRKQRPAAEEQRIYFAACKE
ncbi:MAG: class I SAM-dependent methyltransferase [Oscillospiraceae bacterium]|jgi:ubiquinone/menaquinone biosynthesis C-methylase UbiE|nr:class I SAM-dependent methyltransferase [Oscillospiraceae bacterium]